VCVVVVVGGGGGGGGGVVICRVVVKKGRSKSSIGPANQNTKQVFTEEEKVGLPPSSDIQQQLHTR
jgi:NAD(P)H-hydrate repair Nnr-like enzyme with NAD(P)H-hydrate epimerase domain